MLFNGGLFLLHNIPDDAVCDATIVECCTKAGDKKTFLIESLTRPALATLLFCHLMVYSAGTIVDI